MTTFKTVLVVVAAFIAFGCAGRKEVEAPRGFSGEPITLEVTVGQVPGQNNASQIDTLLTFLVPDLEEKLVKAGYVVVLQPNPQAFVPGHNRYSLVVQVTGYTLSVAPAPTVLESKTELISAPGQILLSYPHSAQSRRGQLGVGTAGDWRMCAVSTNLTVMRTVTKTLHNRR